LAFESLPETVNPAALASDTKFIDNIANSIATAFDVDLSKVRIIDVLVVVGRRLSEAEERQLQGASLKVDYELLTESATEATQVQEALSNPQQSTGVSTSFKSALMEKESASGRDLGNAKVVAAPAIVTTVVEKAGEYYDKAGDSYDTAVQSFSALRSTTTVALRSTTTAGVEEQKISTATANEDERNGNATQPPIVVIVGALVLSCLGGFACFWWRQRVLQKRSNGNNKLMADVETGVGQPGENPEMYPLPTLLKGPSQYCSKKTEMKPISSILSGSTVSVSTAYASTAGSSINKPLSSIQTKEGLSSIQTKEGLSGSTVSVASTAYASTAGSSITSVSTVGTSQSGTENPEESLSEGIEGIKVVMSDVSDVNCDTADIDEVWHQHCMQESTDEVSEDVEDASPALKLPPSQESRILYNSQGLIRPGIEISL